MMNPITILIVLVFAYPILKGFLFKFSPNSLKKGLNGLIGDISFLISVFIGIYLARGIFINHSPDMLKKIYDYMPSIIKEYIGDFPIVVYIIILPVFIYVIYRIITFILDLISSFSLYALIDGVQEILKGSPSILNRMFGAIFEIPRAICYVVILCFIINITTMFKFPIPYTKYLPGCEPYNYVCKNLIVPASNSTIAKAIPQILDNSFKVEVRKINPQKEDGSTPEFNGRTIVYYNGMILDDAVKSNSAIDSFSRQLTSSENTSEKRAYVLYNWIGKNISYDHEKANEIMNNDFNKKSGAISTFNTRKGICFDYSSLYVAMARASGLKVRLITGKGFNGASWVSHAWNQVYLKEQGKWINVDTTFYSAGNYFNSRRFDMDHEEASIAGEW